MRIPKRRSEEERQSREQRDYYLTPEKIERLERELADLKSRARPEAADEARRMAEMGDRSDNAGYTVAKAQLTRINTRILSIEDRLKHAVRITRGSGVGGEVRIGSTVTIRDARNGERTFEILGSSESRPGHGRISYRSPLGAALIGHHAGDEVRVVVNGRAAQCVIVRVV